MKRTLNMTKFNLDVTLKGLLSVIFLNLDASTSILLSNVVLIVVH